MKAIITTAATIIEYPKMGLREKTGMISERQAKAGMIWMLSAGGPKIRNKRGHNTAEPPACVSKKRALRKRSSRSMICAADNGDSASRIMKEVTIDSQTKSGRRSIVIPLQRRLTAVAMTLIAEAILPTPLTSKLKVQ